MSGLTRPPGNPEAIRTACDTLSSVIGAEQEELNGLAGGGRLFSEGFIGAGATASQLAAGNARWAARAALDAMAGAYRALEAYATELETAQKTYDAAMTQVQEGQAMLRAADRQQASLDARRPEDQTDAEQIAVLKVRSNGTQLLDSGTTAAARAYQDAAEAALLCERALAGLTDVFGETGANLLAAEAAINRAGAVDNGPMGITDSETLLADAAQMASLQDRLNRALGISDGKQRAAALSQLFAGLPADQALALAAFDPRVGTSDGVPGFARIASNAAYLAAELSKAQGQLLSCTLSSGDRGRLEKQLAWLTGASQLPWISQPPLSAPEPHTHHNWLVVGLGVLGAAGLTIVNVAQFGADPLTDGLEAADVGGTVAAAGGEVEAAVATAEEAAAADGELASAGQAAAAAEGGAQSNIANFLGRYGVHYVTAATGNFGVRAVDNVASGKPWNEGMDPVNMLGAPAVEALFPGGDSLRAALNTGAASGVAGSLFDQETHSLLAGHGVTLPDPGQLIMDGTAGAAFGGVAHASSAAVGHLTGGDAGSSGADGGSGEAAAGGGSQVTASEAAATQAAHNAADAQKFLDQLKHSAAEAAGELTNPVDATNEALNNLLVHQYGYYSEQAHAAAHVGPGEGGDGGGGGGGG